MAKKIYGKLTSNVTFLDTDRLLVQGEGGVDLASKKLNSRSFPEQRKPAW